MAKSGGGAGFMSYIAFVPGRGAGLLVALSRVDFAMFVKANMAIKWVAQSQTGRYCRHPEQYMTHVVAANYHEARKIG
jgi:hypothetical protein